MPNSPPTAGAKLYELELVGDVHGRSPATARTQRSSSFRVAALWPEAAALAGHQLFIGEAARSGMVVGSGVRVSRCTPLED